MYGRGGGEGEGYLPFVAGIGAGDVVCEGLGAGEFVVGGGRRDDVALGGDLAGEAGDGAGDWSGVRGMVDRYGLFKGLLWFGGRGGSSLVWIDGGVHGEKA